MFETIYSCHPFADTIVKIRIFDRNMSQANSYGASKGTGDASYQTPAKETIVFVYGIGPNADENTLWQMFGPYGNIVVSDVM